MKMYSKFTHELGSVRPPRSCRSYMAALLAMPMTGACPLLALGQTSTAAPAPSSGALGATAVTLPPASPTDPFKPLTWQGLEINFPTPKGTLDPDPAGIRTDLANVGIGYLGFALESLYQNTLDHGGTNFGRQIYNGQTTTLATQNFLAFTYDLGRVGIPNGQLEVAGAFATASWSGLGPRTATLGTLSYYQSLFNKRVEVKLGLINQNFEFAIPYVAGSLATGAFGISSSLFYEVGLTSIFYPTYAINTTFHIDSHFYDKLGISRGGSPDGSLVEHNENPASVDFQVPNTGAVIVNEVGYKQQAAPGVDQMWIRGAPIYSGSQYVNYDRGGRSRGNYMLYLLGDRQIYQSNPTPGKAYRGLYLGFSAEYVPPDLNTFSQYYEARVYTLGILNSRPLDQVSLIVGQNRFSSIVASEARLHHELAHNGATSITGAYSAAIVPGLYANLGLQYTDHPSTVTYTPQVGSALTLIAAITAIL